MIMPTNQATQIKKTRFRKTRTTRNPLRRQKKNLKQAIELVFLKLLRKKSQVQKDSLVHLTKYSINIQNEDQDDSMVKEQSQQITLGQLGIHMQKNAV